jgi:PAS domain S-box-containing protein
MAVCRDFERSGRWGGLLLALLLAAAAVTPGGVARAEEAAGAGAPVRFGCGEHFPPFVYKDEKGRPKGIYVDYWREVSRKTGVAVQWKLMPWEQVIPALLSGKIDVVFGATPSAERRKLLEFSPPFGRSETFLYFRRDLVGIRKPEDLGGFPVGVLAGSITETHLSKTCPGATLIPYPNGEEMVRAATAGKIQIFASEEDLAIYYLARADALDQFRRTEEPFEADELCLAAPKGKTELLAMLSAALEKLSSQEREQIKRRYLGVSLMRRGFFRQALIGLAVCALGLVLVVLWNAMLRRRVRRVTGKLAKSEQDLRITLSSIGDAVIATDEHGAVTRMNPVAESLTGWKEAEARGRPLAEVFKIVNADTREPVENPAERVIRSGEVVGLANHTVLIDRDGGERQIADSGAPIRNDAGKIVGVVLVFRDVTKQYLLENQLRHSEKMQAIGQLAGGVAHDFNNQLAAIMGYADILRMTTAEDKTRTIAGEVVKSAKRSADLTKQLLSFARKGQFLSLAVNLNSIIGEIATILEHSVDKRISIKQLLRAAPSSTPGDPSQIQNALLNIAINARDAIDGTGVITFETDNVELSAERCRELSHKMTPGPYVRLRVSDTGAGMDRAVRERIFEPFFTTKEEGTGMGLAAVYGAVTQHRGAINVESTPGKGTTFEVLFPQGQDAVETKPETRRETVADAARILVIDDEKSVCRMVRDLLGEMGHTSTCCADGAEGIDYYREHWRDLDLVMLDLVMPNLSGRETFAALREINAAIRVVLFSGYSQKGEAQDLLDAGAVGFIQKPFDAAQLAAALREALESQ